MKFAKQLEREAVPEWRIKYLNYKAGKKYVKAVSRAINRTTATPRSNHLRASTLFSPSAQPQLQRLPTYNNNNRDSVPVSAPGELEASSRWPGRSEPVSIAGRAEGEALTGLGNSLQYGSFIPTPSSSRPVSRDDAQDDFALPAPAIHPQSEPSSVSVGMMRPNVSRFDHRASLSAVSASKPDTLPTLTSRNTVNAETSPLRRILSHAGGISRDLSRTFTMQNLDVVREREQEFYAFMDSELEKVETFYKQKEEQAGQRLAILKEQLHEMRNRRIHEMAKEERNGKRSPQQEGSDSGHDKSNGWVHPLKAKIFPPGPNSKALQNMPRTPHLGGGGSGAPEARMDYVRRPQHHEVSYRTAKRKLKLALQEFYRSLELLKSYALLNRTAFRKLNKKFDKAANARPALRYVNEKVNKAWFVNSDVVEGHIKAVEDLYARYFERGNQKLAAGKLRRLTKKLKDESDSSFLSGFLIGTGVVFTVQGLVYGFELLFDNDPTIRLQTSYLLQLYGGYFLMLLLFSLYCINCSVWLRNKVNYPFIFEFDQRSLLDWRQVAEFPSFFLFLLGLVMWANFSRYGDDGAYLYYPVVLIFVTAVVIFFPAPVLAHKSRKWFAYSHWRLLLAGLYPVEFRDFFLGDMYCSLTYAVANVELFFCLYANRWDNPTQCNSNHSRLMGFFTTLPPIWRFLQCIRRYRDTGNVFPHLVNCGKYGMTIIANVLLSVYRIQRSDSNLALFVTFSIINSIYCSIWDLFMDFSLLQPGSRYFCLRDILAFKYRWLYYIIMVVDPVLRFSWILYAIFTHDAQHSTLVSFMVGVMEVCRRGMWALLRVENEHCANVAQYKASRDVPLPYRIEPLMDRASIESSRIQTTDGADEEEEEQETEGAQQPQPQQQQQQQQQQPQQQRQGAFTHAASSTAVASSFGTLRRRRDTISSKLGARSFSKILAEAHKQDFEKKRRPAAEASDDERADDDGHSDEDDEDAESESLMEIRVSNDDRRRDRDDEDAV